VSHAWNRYHSFLFFLLAGLIAGAGCSSNTPTADDRAEGGVDEAAAEDSPGGELPEDEFEPLTPYEAPPLAEIDAEAKWIDQPVQGMRDALRERLKDHPPLVSEEEAMAMRNESDQDNEKIYSVMRQLPASDDQVDWDATFVHYVGGDAKSLNPLFKNSITEFEIQLLTGLNLIEFDADFKPFAPDWAFKSWQTSEDHLMDKFVLRDDLKWSDGTPVTAHDIVFSFKTIMDPRVPILAMRSNVQYLRWVEAYDDQTLVIFHKEPMASWTENISFPVIPKHIYGKHLEDDPTLQNSDYYIKYERRPVTCGPYEIVKRVQGQETVLRRRESFYMDGDKQVREKPYINEFRFRVITDPNTAILALKAGDLDEAMLTAEQWITQTGGDDFYRLNTKLNGDEWTVFHIEWNTKDPRFTDQRVRRAMAYAFNMDEMRQSIFYDLVLPGTGIFHPAAWMASPNIEPFKQDLDKAEDLLDEAGWVDSDGDGVRDKEVNGRRIPLEFTIISYEQPHAIKVCTLLKNNLDQIGVVCHVKPTEFTVKTTLAAKHKFQALMGGWGTGSDPATLVNIFGSGQARNFGQYSNKRVDELFKQGQLEFDREKRAKIYAEIHEILWEDQPSLWLFHRKSLYGVNKRVRGFNFTPGSPFIYDANFYGLWIPKK
jgi:peptide/nickel transport system substrate-binding protein